MAAVAAQTGQAAQPVEAAAEVEANQPIVTDPRLDEDLDWQQCNRGQQLELQPFALQAADGGYAAIEIDADSLEASGEENLVLFNGDVALRQDNQQVFAEQVRYARDSGDLDASGQVMLRRPDLRIGAAQVHYNLLSRTGNAERAEYRLPGIMARGSAQHVEFIDDHHSQYRNITYTTCGPGSSDWLLSAERLELDRAEGLGTAHEAELSFLGVPVMWAPTLTFPIDDRRRSGLLIPSFGYSNNQGFDLSTPYYLNLAPNYDLTLTPRLMSRRGAMLSGQFRFLSETTSGEIAADYLPSDKVSKTQPDNRGSLSVQTRSRFSPHTTAAIRFNQVSDEEFLDDLGSSLEITSTSYLERTAEVRYDTDNWNAFGRVQSYQTVDTLLAKVDRPYDRLPQVAFSGDQGLGDMPLALQVDGEFVQFAKNGGFVEGTRIDLQPGVSLPLRKSHYFLTPRLSARYTSYRLENQTPGLDDNPERFAPILSMDGGLYFDRPGSWFGESVNQSLEPRLYYLLVPKKDHSDIPVFDTSEYDFSFDNLFRENRFNGADRLGDANQLTLALTSRFNHDASGRELLRASIGHIFYFEDRQVQLPGIPVDSDSNSAVLGELASDFGNGWHSRGGLLWDPDNSNIDQALAQASYRDEDDNIVSLTYRLRDGVTEHTDVGAIWPVNANTRLIGRWNYSLSEGRNLEALAGVEYGRCCWRVRTLVRQYSDGPGNRDNIGVLVQLELNGLGSLGNNIDSLLNDGIYGYRRDYD